MDVAVEQRELAGAARDSDIERRAGAHPVGDLLRVGGDEGASKQCRQREEAGAHGKQACGETEERNAHDGRLLSDKRLRSDEGSPDRCVGRRHGLRILPANGERIGQRA